MLFIYISNERYKLHQNVSRQTNLRVDGPEQGSLLCNRIRAQFIHHYCFPLDLLSFSRRLHHHHHHYDESRIVLPRVRENRRPRQHDIWKSRLFDNGQEEGLAHHQRDLVYSQLKRASVRKYQETCDQALLFYCPFRELTSICSTALWKLRLRIHIRIF